MNKSNSKPLPNTNKSKQTVLKVNEPSELLKFLVEKHDGKSRNKLKAYLAHKQITVNGKVVTQFNQVLEPGQEVVVHSMPVKEENRYFGLRIIFEDEYLIVIEKKAGLLSIGTDKDYEKTAYSILSEHVKKENSRNKIFVIHRLDRETSGLMMFAKSVDIQKAMQESWDETVLERSYIAVVQGNVEREEATITTWLKESVALKMHSSSYDNGGQKAITHYKVLRKNKYYSLLEIKLETGRKNQIRVHMQDIGHSIVGDKKYGSKQNPISRIALHANVLSFMHPVHKEIKRFESVIPSKFAALFTHIESK